MKDKHALLVFSHPDDESFGPAGTIALWAEKGYVIHLISATKGEIGNNHTNGETATLRERELKKAAGILGVKKVNFLGYKDGHIANRHVPLLEKRIADKIRVFKPEIVMTFNLNGVSGHLDHVAVANATTSAFDKTNIAKKLYYYSLPRAYTDTVSEYFIHFPDGFDEKDFDETVDISSVWEKKIAAMNAHESQKEDIERVLNSYKKYLEKKEYFMVRRAHGKTN